MSGLPADYRLWRGLLDRYQASRSPAFRRGVEGLVKAAVLAGRSWKGTVFPETATGGWWWTWRWRLEVLMGWNEAESVVWCRRLIRPGMTVLDVGAHIGYYTALFSRLVGESGRVWAFEPHPENFAVLEANARGRNVRRLQAAVGEAPGRATLHVSPGSSNHSLAPGYTESRGSLEVERVALDAWHDAGELPRVDFVKIDVEGGEAGVLAGMARLLAASPGAALLVELNPRALACAGSSTEDLLGSLRALGFEPWVILPDAGLAPPEPHHWGSGEGAVNLLCLRPGSVRAAAG